MRHLSLFLLGSIGCDTAAPDSGDSTADQDPYAIPNDYLEQWDLESLSCDGALGYWAFDGEFADDGKLSGAERWFWFFPADDPTADCVDTFTLDGEVAATPVDDDPCLSCDRDVTASYALTEKTCNWDGYESLLDNNDETDTVDDETYKLALMFDLDRYDGIEVDVWDFVQDPESKNNYLQRDNVKGVWSGADKDAAGHISWANEGMCVEIITEE
ncbi:MAG: hypothetical protein EXR71_17860 [Myxococcales bacterium]|nr:hypothetical protein [Myxococcales bacterium]